MQHPFQCIATVQPHTHDRSGSYLLAAYGPKLCSVAFESGDLVSEWSAVDAENRISPPSSEEEGDDRPAKKRKTTSGKPTIGRDIIKLSVSPKHNYVLVVTEDKNLRVFAFSDTGHLNELSVRCMPKRPCAVQILPDNSTILCGDKFGDVYSLPLLPDPAWLPLQDDAGNDELSTNFKPSATSKTVHTQRNLKTLEAQQSQKFEPAKPKDTLNFEHQLLLGHVSMLTDLAYTTVAAEGGKQKSYIVTADRDEHIRFSRGPPQSHIIDGYCLGHTDFVSKLCFVPGTPWLVSGGGDGWLGLWNWNDYSLRGRIHLNGVFDSPSAVSLLKIITFESGDFLLIGCERSSKLGLIELKDLAANEGLYTSDSLVPSNIDLVSWSVLDLDLPILDVVSTNNLMLLSFDAREGGKGRLGAYRLIPATPTGWTLDSDRATNEKLQKLNSTTAEAMNEKDIDGLLYGTEKLRKRGYHEEAAEDE